jgi:hypothetical protein
MKSNLTRCFLFFILISMGALAYAMYESKEDRRVSGLEVALIMTQASDFKISSGAYCQTWANQLKAKADANGVIQEDALIDLPPENCVTAIQ